MHVSLSSCATASHIIIINDRRDGCTEVTNAVGESRAHARDQ